MRSRILLNLSMGRTAERVYHALKGYSLLRAYKACEVVKLYSNAFKWLQDMVYQCRKHCEMDAYLARLFPFAHDVMMAVYHFECTMARGERADKRAQAADVAIGCLRRGIDFMKGEYEKVFGEQL